jgi:hypothetical protein
MAEVTVKLDTSAFAALNAPGGMVDRAVQRAAGKVRDDAKQVITTAGRVDTGALRQSITSRRIDSGRNGVVYEVGSDLFYAIYQHEGVRGPIYPRHARVLRFTPKGGSAFIFRPQVSGFDGVPFLTQALGRLTASDFSASGL